MIFSSSEEEEEGEEETAVLFDVGVGRKSKSNHGKKDIDCQL